MGVPSSRTPVRVARGTYANLSTTNAVSYTHLTLPTICSV